MISSKLPGADLIDEGLADLKSGEITVAALLVSIGAPRLQMLGYEVPNAVSEPEHRLYALLAREGERIERFMRAIAGVARREVRVCLRGGTTTVPSLALKMRLRL